MSKRKASKWELVPLQIPKGKKSEHVKHWEKVGEGSMDPPNDVSVHPTCVIEYTGDIVTRVVIG